MALGSVKFYRADKGWGAISSDELPPGRDAWVHFMYIDMPGFKTLDAGDEVEFEYSAQKQDSFDYVATRVRKLQRTSRRA